jgi:hypothetical protein
MQGINAMDAIAKSLRAWTLLLVYQLPEVAFMKKDNQVLYLRNIKRNWTSD